MDQLYSTVDVYGSYEKIWVTFDARKVLSGGNNIDNDKIDNGILLIAWRMGQIEKKRKSTDDGSKETQK